jgi:hypothetical protein
MELQTKKEHLIETLGKLKNAEAVIVSVTEMSLENKGVNVKSRITGQPTPENLTKVKKYALRKDLLIAADYEKVVKKYRFKEAGIIGKVKKIFTGDNFHAEGTYTERVTGNGVVLQHKENKTKYLRVLYTPDSEVKSEYYDRDGANITDNFKALQEEYFKKPGENKKQGLEEPILVNNFKLDGVKYLEVDGQVIVNELTSPIMRKLGME